MKMLRGIINVGWPGWLLLAVIVLFILAILVILYAIYCSINEQEQWDAFAKAHDCKKVSVISAGAQPTVGFGLTSRGQMGYGLMTTITPSRTSWLCDDGITYWR